VFVAFGSYCDLGSYHGYLMAFDETNLAPPAFMSPQTMAMKEPCGAAVRVRQLIPAVRFMSRPEMAILPAVPVGSISATASSGSLRREI
jgi:hypothetical protein